MWRQHCGLQLSFIVFLWLFAALQLSRCFRCKPQHLPETLKWKQSKPKSVQSLICMILSSLFPSFSLSLSLSFSHTHTHIHIHTHPMPRGTHFMSNQKDTGSWVQQHSPQLTWTAVMRNHPPTCEQGKDWRLKTKNRKHRQAWTPADWRIPPERASGELPLAY